MKRLSAIALTISQIVMTTTLLGGNTRSQLYSPFVQATGVKWPNSAEEGDFPVIEKSYVAKDLSLLEGYTELLPYILPSPNQEEAGSCLYMSLTGAAEWWLAKLFPEESRGPNGPLDLSERYLMNLAGIEEDRNGMANWKTDSIFLFNQKRQGVLNRSYPFTKGYYKNDSDGNVVLAEAGQELAEYGAYYNWISGIDAAGEVSGAEVRALPEFKRQILFADPDSDQWNTVVAPANIVEKIKIALRANKAPIHVIYNHYGYWHANLIVGYDDSADSQGCTFVDGFPSYMEKRAKEWEEEAAATIDDSKKKKSLEDKAKRYYRYGSRVAKAYQDQGGCTARGVFYVRDSLYSDPELPLYDYDVHKKGEESHYAKKVVLRSYDWVRLLANHISQILVQDGKPIKF